MWWLVASEVSPVCCICTIRKWTIVCLLHSDTYPPSYWTDSSAWKQSGMIEAIASEHGSLFGSSLTACNISLTSLAFQGPCDDCLLRLQLPQPMPRKCRRGASRFCVGSSAWHEVIVGEGVDSSRTVANLHRMKKRINEIVAHVI
jgi:hypothetical protein